RARVPPPPLVPHLRTNVVCGAGVGPYPSGMAGCRAGQATPVKSYTCPDPGRRDGGTVRETAVAAGMGPGPSRSPGRWGAAVAPGRRRRGGPGQAVGGRGAAGGAAGGPAHVDAAAAERSVPGKLVGAH